MHRIIKSVFLVLLMALLWPFCSYANVVVKAEAPEAVAVDEQFRIVFTVNSQSVSHVSALADVPGFEVLYGPSRSQNYSVQIINGKKSESSTTTYTYVLMAKKNGTFTMPRLTVTVGGKTYTSNAVNVRVVSNANGQSSSEPAAVRQVSSGTISNKDLFIAVTANKDEVYEQEPVLLTYRVYTRVNLTELHGNMPDLKGFMVKEVQLPQQKSFSIGTFKNENYYTTIWNQYLMFPQQTGRLQIPPIKFDGVVTLSNPDLDLLDAFFNGTAGQIRKKKTIVAPSLSIKVKPLPEKPADFSGGVGSFTIQSKVVNPRLKQNETLNFQVIISGVGNVDLIKAPKVQFPADFDVYEPKMKNTTQLDGTTMNGRLVIDYPAVPKNKGHYTIPPVVLTYFDTGTRSYKTLQTQPIEIDVLKGEKNVYADKQRELLAKSDIRYIHTGDVTLHRQGHVFWNTYVYWLLYLLGLLLLGCVLYLLTHRQSLQSNWQGRGSNVRKASRRLKKARQLATHGKLDAFYEEILSTLYGFVAERLGLPVSELNKDNLIEQMKSRGVEEQLCQDFIHLLDECEFIRYAGGTDMEKKKDDIYRQGLEMISLLDCTIKKK